jgi:hypothetical protein
MATTSRNTSSAPTAAFWIYDEGIRVQNRVAVYCSDWCIEWAKLRDSGKDYFQLPIVQPTIKTLR